jgi:hypothetical protein
VALSAGVVCTVTRGSASFSELLQPAEHRSNAATEPVEIMELIKILALWIIGVLMES